MIKITNGKITTTVTDGAFKSYFSKHGYRKVEDEPNVDVTPATVQEEHDEFADLVKKPVSQWSKHELQEFVKAKGISTHEAKTVNDVKAIVKSFIDENY